MLECKVSCSLPQTCSAGCDDWNGDNIGSDHSLSLHQHKRLHEPRPHILRVFGTKAPLA